MAKDKDGITPLLQSGKEELINSRFLVKASIMDTGNTRTICLVITDLVESAFSVKFFSKESDATDLLKYLKLRSE